MFTTMLTIGSAILAFLVRGWFSDRAVEKLKQERNDALASSKQHEISAKAKDIEATWLREQQKKEDGRNASDGNSVATELDNMFRPK
jgi:hypothetical protein